jgi:phosphoglycerate dehydrogenase-like enzyme
MLASIGDVDNRVNVTTFTDTQRSLLFSSDTARYTSDVEVAKSLISEAEVVFCGHDAVNGGELFLNAPNLRWLHTITAGVDAWLASGYGKGSYVFTSGNGPHAWGIGEFVLLQILMLAKCAPQFLRNQAAGRWDRVSGMQVHGKTVGIVGYGHIGRGVAERVRPLGCHIIATRRSVDQKQIKAGPVDELLPSGELAYLLRESDFIVLCAPLTRETHHLINADMLRLMKPTAYLVNIGRGAVIDQAALVEALRSGTIAGAALDVFEEEPLPADNPLWKLENVIITPHISPGPGSELHLWRQVDLFTDNLRRYLAGEPLLNVVDVDRGYK